MLPAKLVFNHSNARDYYYYTRLTASFPRQPGYYYTLHLFNGHFSGTTRVSQYQKGKTNLDVIGARDSEWQWHQLGHMQICTSIQTDNHANTPPLSFLQAGCPSCRPTNSVKALKALGNNNNNNNNHKQICIVP